MTHPVPPRATPPQPKDGWTGTWLTLAVLIALTIGGLGALGARSQSHGQQLPPRTLVDSGADKWTNVHKDLLVAASKLEAPTVLPPAVGESAAPPAQAHVVGRAANPGQVDALPAVPPEQKVVFGLTSGVIGEVDPCG
ncbi:MAG: hypothetical protein HY902_02140 [Deltaproteobacteria bacterium]|nr:hypothetical protein [Deltaproteobacteria bacterium]